MNLSLPAAFDRDSIITSDHSLWRYRHVLPLPANIAPVTLCEGLTPLIPIDWNNREILFKLDYMCPSGSFKDRGTTVLVSQLKTWGINNVVEDSSGNAGASLATYAALAGINSTIYVPASASRGKLLQVALSGAKLVAVPGNRENTAQAVLTAAKKAFYASHNLSPFFIVGVTTLAYELIEQLNWDAPGAVIIPAGNGSLVLGLFAGFKLLKQSGLIASIPRLIAVQAAACAPLATAFTSGDLNPAAISKGPTLAEGIASQTPPRGQEVLAAVSASGGTFITVAEKEILVGIKALAECGLYVEPTAATVAAALNKLIANNRLPNNHRIVAVLTGSGLKATDKLQELF
ncbi:MAG: threonine synthase [bacterium]